jgi:hypothetical protein
MSRDDEQRKLILEAGSLVVLYSDGPVDAFPVSTCVERVAEGKHWFLGSCEPLREGDSLMVEYAIPDEALYTTDALIEICSASGFALKIEPLWERVQKREFVRIMAFGLQVRVVRSQASRFESEQPDADTAADAAGSVYPLLDISAGGISFQSSADFEPGEQVICHLELPGSDCMILPAEIILVPADAPIHRQKPEVAVEFQCLDESHRSQVLRWVYQEQARRHRRAKSSPPKS